MNPLAVRLSLLLCLLCAVPIFAQTADVSGTVTDPSGAVIPKASVRILNESTLVERDIETNNDGVFSAPSIQPGVYRFYVEAPGFSTKVINDVKIDVAANVDLPIRLKVGKAAQVIHVDG